MASGKQQQRTESTIGLLLESATRLFGERGYAGTSLEDIALDCGLTIGAIYHHFGNKKALFSAVNEAAEQRIIDAGKDIAAEQASHHLLNQWQVFMNLCDEPGFRRIVLVDSPNILGRDRWATSAVSKNAAAAIPGSAGNRRRQELALRILRGAMVEAALALAEADNSKATRQAIDDIVRQTIAVLAGHFQVDTVDKSHKEQ
jgi:AcrR family transcriptional regulator